MDTAVTSLGACLSQQIQPGLRLAGHVLGALKGLAGSQQSQLGIAVCSRLQPTDYMRCWTWASSQLECLFIIKLMCLESELHHSAMVWFLGLEVQGSGFRI